MEDSQIRKVISVTIKDKAALRAAYMPFIAQGGLFVPTSGRYQLGDSVELVMDLMEEPENFTVKGQVVWITPVGAQGTPGIGIGFLGDFELVRSKIESYLVGILDSDQPTHTL